MTLDDLKTMTKEFLTPREVAQVLQCTPFNINVAVKTNPAALGFPTIKIGNRVKVPRMAFIRFMEGK